MPSPNDHDVEVTADQASTAVTEYATGVPAVPEAGTLRALTNGPSTS